MANTKFNTRVVNEQPLRASRERIPRSLCAAMLLQFAAGGAVIPFVSLILRDRGLEMSRISQIYSVSSAALLVFPFFWGMLADRYMRLDRLFILLNLIAAAALTGFATQAAFTCLLIFFTLFVACLSPMFSLINALSFHHLPNAPRQFGLLRAWGSLGWIIPFLPISLWMARAQQTTLDFALYIGIGACLGMALLSFWLPHTPPGARAGATPASVSGPYLPALKRLLLDPNYLIVLASMFLVAGSYSLFLYYSPPFLEDMGVPRLWIGPVQSIGVIAEILFFQVQPVLIQRWNYTAIILLGCGALLLRHLVYAFSASIWILCLSYVFSGMVIVFYHMGVSVLVNAMAGPELRSTAQTLLVFFSSGLGPMFANAMAGRLAARSANNLRPVFFFAAVLAAIAGLLILARGRRLNRPGIPPPSPSAAR